MTAPRPTRRESLQAWGKVLALVVGFALVMLVIWELKSLGSAPTPAARATAPAGRN